MKPLPPYTVEIEGELAVLYRGTKLLFRSKEHTRVYNMADALNARTLNRKLKRVGGNKDATTD